MSVSVSIQGGTITNVQITSVSTQYPVSRIASLPGAVVKQQTASVNVISGATYSSQAFTQAVQQALTLARVSSAGGSRLTAPYRLRVAGRYSGENPFAMRVLIVEDEPLVARAIERALFRAGHQTEVAYDGADGLLRAETGGHDLIVLDVLLPEIDGLAVCRELRQRRSRRPSCC